MRNLFLCFLFFTSHQSFAKFGNSYRAKAEILRNKGYEIKGQTEYFLQTARYDLDGKEIEDTEETQFTMSNNHLNFAYGFGNTLEFQLDANFRMVNGVKTVNQEEIKTSKSGAESVKFEALYGFSPVGPWRYGASLFYRHTLFSTSKALSSSFAKDEIDLGDDGSEYGGGVFFSHGNSGWIFDGELQFVSPPNNLAREIRYLIGANYKTTSWAFMSGISGSSSLGDDEYTDIPSEKLVSSSVNYTSLFDSINRSYMKPFVGLSYAFDSFALFSKASTILSPVSSDSGHEIVFGFSLQEKGETELKVKTEKFKEYAIDGSVLKISGRGNFVKIDQGLQADVEKGKKFDLYQTDYFGGNELVAEGVVYEVGSDWSIIKITKKFKNVEIRPGFSARGN